MLLCKKNQWQTLFNLSPCTAARVHCFYPQVPHQFRHSDPLKTAEFWGVEEAEVLCRVLLQQSLPLVRSWVCKARFLRAHSRRIRARKQQLLPPSDPR